MRIGEAVPGAAALGAALRDFADPQGLALALDGATTVLDVM